MQKEQRRYETLKMKNQTACWGFLINIETQCTTTEILRKNKFPFIKTIWNH